MTIVLRSGAATDAGRVRSVNQDAYLVVDDRRLWVVADGMGGHQGGEVASRLAVDVLRAAYTEPSRDALVDAIGTANGRIRDEGLASPQLRGMGTTVVAATLVADEPDADEPGAVAPGAVATDAEGVPHHLLVANVGDSRAYLYRDDELIQLTDDHSMVADLVRQGRLSPEDAEQHPQRNIVTRALGVTADVDVDLFPVDPLTGDRFVLCSDGLFNEVPADRIGAVLRRLADPHDAARELVRLANEGGGRDNITVLVLDVVDDGGVARAASEAVADQPAPPPGRSASAHAVADPAGFSTALDDDALQAGAVPGEDSGADDQHDERPRARTRFTWRLVVFTLVVLAVIGGAFATIQWYGTNAYFVTFADDEVAIFKGRPGGLLWIDPTLEESTGITRDDVPATYVGDLDDGREYSSLDDAQTFVRNIERDIRDAEREARRRAATTTTTEQDETAAQDQVTTTSGAG